MSFYESDLSPAEFEAAIAAARAMLVDGNLVLANGKGIDFSATPGSGSSEVLDDYEVGTWSPTLSFGTDVVLGSSTGDYIKIGKLVFVTFDIEVISHTQPDPSPVSINGLPYNVAGNVGALFNLDPQLTTFLDLAGHPLGGPKTAANTFIQLYEQNGSALTYTEANASGRLVGAFQFITTS